MYCPRCSNNNITNKGSSPNGGDLFVAEEDKDGCCIECYDEDITQFECIGCSFIFYASPSVNF